MRRGWSVLISCAILAAGGYLAWRLAFQPPETRRLPPTVPGAGVEETRPAASQPAVRGRPDSAPVADDRPSSEDRISGVIYDESSQPVPDAAVQIISFTYMSTSTRPLDRRFEDRVHASTVTGDDGKFVFTGQVPGEVKILRVSKPGFVTQMKDGVRVPSNRNFQLVPGAVVTGVIVNATTGAPIEGVGIKGFFPATAQPILATEKAFRWKEEVFTNAKGEFAFEGAPDGIVKFMLTHPEYEDVVDDLRVRLGTKNVLAFKMKPALVIEGVVLHAKKGTPVADLDVVAFDFIPIAVAPRWKARTDKDGRFKMAGVRSGTVRFEVSGRGFNPVAEARELTPAEDCTGGRPCRKLEFQVNPAGRIAGKITTPSGEPVARARIYVAPVRGIFTMVRDPGQHGGSIADGEFRSDERGAFLVDDITPGPHRLVVEAPGFALTASEGMEVAPDEIRENVDFILQPAPVIRGSVTDEVRVPVANAQVTIEVPAFGQVAFGPAFGLGQKDRRTAVTDDLGRYRIEAPYAGKFPISVDHPDFALVEGGEIAAEEAQPEVVRDFTLKRALSISGTVFGPSGQGEAGAVVQAWAEAGGAAAGEVRTGARRRLLPDEARGRSLPRGGSQDGVGTHVGVPRRGSVRFRRRRLQPHEGRRDRRDGHRLFGRSGSSVSDPSLASSRAVRRDRPGAQAPHGGSHRARSRRERSGRPLPHPRRRSRRVGAADHFDRTRASGARLSGGDRSGYGSRSARSCSRPVEPCRAKCRRPMALRRRA